MNIRGEKTWGRISPTLKYIIAILWVGEMRPHFFFSVKDFSNTNMALNAASYFSMPI